MISSLFQSKPQAKKEDENELKTPTEIKELANFVPEHSPTILNASKHSIVVFQERGTLFNRQVLEPGQAVSMTKKQTGGHLVLPYKVHAVIGNEASLPTAHDSRKNLIKVTAIPAAFVTGCMVTAVSAGMLLGPSAALAPLVSGMVVNGVVIDSAALAAGGLAATKAQAVTDRLLKEQPDKFMNKTERLRPGVRYLVVTGGLGDGTVTIEEVSKKDFEKNYAQVVYKPPLMSNSTTEYCLPDSMKDPELMDEEQADGEGEAIVKIEN